MYTRRYIHCAPNRANVTLLANFPSIEQTEMPLRNIVTFFNCKVLMQNVSNLASAICELLYAYLYLHKINVYTYNMCVFVHLPATIARTA